MIRYPCAEAQCVFGYFGVPPGPAIRVHLLDNQYFRRNGSHHEADGA